MLPVSSQSTAEVGAATSASPVESGDESSEVLKLATLFDVSQALSGPLNLKEGLHRVLEILQRRCEVIRGTITLLDLAAGELCIEASLGLLPDGRIVRYRLGEGITGRVVEGGKPIVVPEVGREPRFLHRAAKRLGPPAAEVSFLCVPILLDLKPIGALSVDLPFQPDRNYDRMVKFLHVVSSLMAQALKIQRLVDEERERLRDENLQLRQELRERYDFANIIGTSGPMRQVYEQIAMVTGTNTTVILRGQSGTGKELIAHAIHHHSARAKGPLIKVNCAALPESLIESELFGHERGAFTGALNRKKGRFEMAHQGTLLLDEIGDLSPATQVKLLRVLQEREFERLGGTETIRVDVRLIAATNTDLEKAIEAGRFREDLYYRLNVFSIFVPPLRERRSDILLLADHFVEKYARTHGKRIRRVTTPAIDMLMSYHWPGNVRELENVIERAVVVCGGRAIHAHHLPPTLQTAEASGTGVPDSFAGAVAAYEKDLIQDALKTARGNRAAAARVLQTTERILGYKIRKYRLDPDRYRV